VRPPGLVTTLDTLALVTLARVHRPELLRTAALLAWFTVGWNVVEGVVAMTAAVAAGSRALGGFAVDSGVESLSGAVLLWRLRAEQRQPARAARVEARALRLIGVTFVVLAAVVAAEAIRSLAAGLEPDASPVGIAVTAISLVVMPVLARRKRLVGRALASRAVVADSAQTYACVALSAVVLAGLALNAALGWWWADPVAALAVVVFLVREGSEALRAEHLDDCC
jgi:divalent metal cation (Fe/Co/Zn/Cd) transporter